MKKLISILKKETAFCMVFILQGMVLQALGVSDQSLMNKGIQSSAKKELQSSAKQAVLSTFASTDLGVINAPSAFNQFMPKDNDADSNLLSQQNSAAQEDDFFEDDLDEMDLNPESSVNNGDQAIAANNDLTIAGDDHLNSIDSHQPNSGNKEDDSFDLEGVDSLGLNQESFNESEDVSEDSFIDSADQVAALNAAAVLSAAAADKKREILLYVQEQVNQSAVKFESSVKKQLQDLKNKKSFASDYVVDFSEGLSQNLRWFTGAMVTLERQAISDYYLFESKQSGKALQNLRDLSVDSKNLFNAIHSITQVAITQAQALILGLTSKQTIVAQEVASAFETYERQAEANYRTQLAENESELNRAWLQRIKESGSDFLGEFSSKLTAGVKQEVAKQTQQFVEKQIGRIVPETAKQVFNAVSPLASLAVTQQKALMGILNKTPLGELIKNRTDEGLKALRSGIKAINPVPLPAQTVLVQTDLKLDSAESNFLKNRLPRVQQALDKNFGIQAPLKVSWCFSGGGVRAMFMTEATLAAAAKYNLLDISTYLVGLSGSTWCIAPWCYAFVKGYTSKNISKSLNQYLQSVEAVLQNTNVVISEKQSIYGPTLLDSATAQKFYNDLIMRFGFNQNITLVDIYGSLVGNFALNLAGENKLQAKWSSMCHEAEYGTIPWPLCSAILNSPHNNVSKSGQTSWYEWFEMSPSSAGSPLVGYIPTQYLGSFFKNGTLGLDSICPEYPLSFYLGVCGSAFAAVSADGIIDHTMTNIGFDFNGIKISIPVDEWVRKIIDDNLGNKARQYLPEKLYAHFPNYSVGLLSSILQNETDIGLFDGGIDFNFPLPLLFDRPVRQQDIIFLIDSNDGDERAFRVADRYFKRKQITTIPDFSKVDAKMLQQSSMTVLNDPRTKEYDPAISTIINFSLQGISAKFGFPYVTLNFKYTPEQVQVITDIMTRSIDSNIEEIKHMMQLVAQIKYKVEPIQAKDTVPSGVAKLTKKESVDNKTGKVSMGIALKKSDASKVGNHVRLRKTNGLLGKHAAQN